MIRVLSCNLFLGRADPEALRRIVADEGIDVVCAQELTDGLATRLAAWLPYGDVAQDGAPRGNGIACRHPAATRRIPIGHRSGCVARLSPADWPGLDRPLDIVNVHIAAPHLWPYFPSPVRRRAQLETLLADRAQAGDVAQAIVGDFNASPAWTVYRRMAARFRDAALVGGSAIRPGNTWPRLRRLGLDGLLRIDHCFVRGVEVRGFRTVDLPGSDHMALVVELAMPADAGTRATTSR